MFCVYVKEEEKMENNPKTSLVHSRIMLRHDEHIIIIYKAKSMMNKE